MTAPMRPITPAGAGRSFGSPPPMRPITPAGAGGAMQPVQPMRPVAPPQPLYDPTEQDPYAQDQGVQTGYGAALAAELVKSYGFKRSPQGQWSWSVENIGEAFKESPVWTSIDYLTLAVPVAKWGVGAARVARGVTAAGRAYEAGAIGFMDAARLAKNAAPRTRFGRAISSVAGRTIDPEYMRLIEQYGADPAEVRGLYDVMSRELQVEREALKRFREDQLRALGRLDDPTQIRITEGLEQGLDPAAFAAQGGISPAAARAYQKTFEYRGALHEQAFDAGLISEATYVANLQKYFPKLYEEYAKATSLTQKAVARNAPGRSGISRSSDRFKFRTAPDHPELTRIMDPKLGVMEMARAADLVAKQQFAQRLAGSVIAKTPDELIDYVEHYADLPAGKLLGMNDFEIAHVKAFGANPANYSPRAGIGQSLYLKSAVEMALEKNLGWKKLDDLYTSKIPGYVDRLPDELKGKYIDPAVLDDVLGIFKFWDEAKPINTVMQMASRVYNNSLAFFRAGKTAYNPSTHFRNYFGNVVFRHLATGGMPKLFPGRGFKAYLEQGADYTEAIHAGIVGSSFDNEVREALAKAVAGLDPVKAERIAAGRVSALDFLGNGAVAKAMQRGAGSAERFYRGIDEVWKLDTFVSLRDRYLKKGLTREDAIARASIDIAKFMPQFSTHAPIWDGIRKGIPFASFTSEALRVWKNALAERPLQTFFWTHLTDAASYAIGSANGYSPEELNEYKNLLPDFTANKKMMLLPFNVGGKPSFIDMSYLIPMANLSEAEQTENAFFGGLTAIVDPSANPALNIAMAGTTGVDPFTGKPVEPRQLERALGTPVTDNPYGRRMIGMAEHMAQVMLPPLMPPGYAAANLIELARGDVNPETNLPYEPDVGRTIAANLFGMRAYEASVPSQLMNVRRAEQKIGDKMKVWTDTYKRARANGDLAEMRIAEANIVRIREELEPGTGEDYFEEFTKRTAPGEYRGVSTRMLEDVLNRARKIDSKTAEDQRALAELYARMRERSGAGRRARRSRPTRGK